MDVITHFNAARSCQTGFSAEQYLHNNGFYEIGRRTNAAAWCKPDDETYVIRISEDALGSSEFYQMAQKMEGNPYLPIVAKEDTLPSGDHIACVERLVSLTHKDIYHKYKAINENLKSDNEVDEASLSWKDEIDHSFITATEISAIFMQPGFSGNITSFPNPAAFKEATIAMLELSERVHNIDSRMVPGPDMNRTNILFRRTAEGLHPVFNDPLIRQHDWRCTVNHTNELRGRYGLPPLDLK